MILEIFTRIGEPPLRIEATQLLIMNKNGTPLGLAAEYGGDGCVKVCHAADAEFNQSLRVFGYDRLCVQAVSVAAPPPPAGARLLQSR